MCDACWAAQSVMEQLCHHPQTHPLPRPPSSLKQICYYTIKPLQSGTEYFIDGLVSVFSPLFIQPDMIATSPEPSGSSSGVKLPQNPDCVTVTTNDHPRAQAPRNLIPSTFQHRQHASAAPKHL